MDTQVERVRHEIANGTYLTDDKIDVVVSEISKELGIVNPGKDVSCTDERP